MVCDGLKRCLLVEKEEGKKKKFVCQELSFRRKRKRDTERRGGGGTWWYLPTPTLAKQRAPTQLRVDNRVDLPQLSRNQPETSQRVEELSHSVGGALEMSFYLTLFCGENWGANQ